MVIQLTGLSGAGKTTISEATKDILAAKGQQVEILDGDVIRRTIHKDLGYTKADRQENIRRLGAMAFELSKKNKVVIIAAINPYEEIRHELASKYEARTVWIHCALNVLIERDTKGLYKRAFLPDDHPQKIFNLSGVNDEYQEPGNADLKIDTGKLSVEESSKQLSDFILVQLGI